MTKNPNKQPGSAGFKAIAFCAVVLLLLAVNALLGLTDCLDASTLAAQLSSLVDENLALALAVYLVAVVIGSTALALPGVLFAVVAGACFGPVLGTAACVVASCTGAVAAFITGRYFLRDWVKPRVEQNALLAKWLFGSQVNAVTLLAITRLVPIFPFNLQNFAYGITDIKLSVYTFCTAVFIVPGCALYVTATAGIVDPTQRITCFACSAALLAVTLMASAFLRKRYLGKEDEHALS